ncbi:hypothetical protein DQ04_00311190 [Trypanosoma grayi]|uniref:hypothetical protein n=1 Tax=Trypanosoma grayi TaxID=71804 RepID=UPI0004F45F75|nr:hypothetical protein DQ04_00311190 [Trypanosoma grayi]KEG14783.1 hypothetical protein DQ04_00311190 [Trypanosoma grayi]
MVAAVEGGASGRQRIRAVAAVTEVDAALSESALIAGGLHVSVPLPLREKPIVRHANFSAMIQAHLIPDPHGSEREALRELQMVPVLRDEFAVLDDATLRTICAFLGERSKDAVHFGSVCRRLRNIVIALTPVVAVVVPDMIPLTSLSSHTVVDSLCAFFATYKRGQFVQELRLVDANHASSLSVAATLPVCSPHVFPSLVKLLPSLTYLDLRGVRWDCHACPGLSQYFLSDLHLVAPKLRTLKVGMELFSHWSPGWWQRLSALEQLVVGSRRDQVVGAGTAPAATTLHEEMFNMLRAPRRPWRLKLWCALERDMLVRVLMPLQPYPDLQELTLNLSNTDVLEEFKRPRTKSPKDNKSRRSTRKTTIVATDEVDLRSVFPSLQALTLANADQSAHLASELLERMAMHAPQLKYFSVVNTARVPPPPTKPRRRG